MKNIMFFILGLLSLNIFAMENKSKGRNMVAVCFYCREAHVWCDRGFPCFRCSKKNKDCVYSGTPKDYQPKIPNVPVQKSVEIKNNNTNYAPPLNKKKRRHDNDNDQYANECNTLYDQMIKKKQKHQHNDDPTKKIIDAPNEKLTITEANQNEFRRFLQEAQKNFFSKNRRESFYYHLEPPEENLSEDADKEVEASQNQKIFHIDNNFVTPNESIKNFSQARVNHEQSNNKIPSKNCDAIFEQKASKNINFFYQIVIDKDETCIIREKHNNISKTKSKPDDNSEIFIKQSDKCPRGKNIITQFSFERKGNCTIQKQKHCVFEIPSTTNVKKTISCKKDTPTH